MSSQIVYEDQWGEIINRSESGYSEIRWYDTTVKMTGEQFNQFLAEYATCIEKSMSGGALVDSVQFKMPMERMSMGWRDKNIIPRYNAAGVKKFAFIMPPGMPAIGAAPAVEGPAKFPTAYFDSRAAAIEWLKEI